MRISQGSTVVSERQSSKRVDFYIFFRIKLNILVLRTRVAGKDNGRET